MTNKFCHFHFPPLLCSLFFMVNGFWLPEDKWTNQIRASRDVISLEFKISILFLVFFWSTYFWAVASIFGSPLTCVLTILILLTALRWNINLNSQFSVSFWSPVTLVLGVAQIANSEENWWNRFQLGNRVVSDAAFFSSRSMPTSIVIVGTLMYIFSV